MSTRLHIVVPDDTLARIEAERGLVPRSRFVVSLIERGLDQDATYEHGYRQGYEKRAQVDEAPLPSTPLPKIAPRRSV